MSASFNHFGTQLLTLRRRLPPVLYDISNANPLCDLDHDGYYNSCTMKSCCFAGPNDEVFSLDTIFSALTHACLLCTYHCYRKSVLFSFSYVYHISIHLMIANRTLKPWCIMIEQGDITRHAVDSSDSSEAVKE